jgi:DNA-binding transcriptional MerR regulator
MKISELVKDTGVPRETIHFYIREGLLRKPRKTSRNTAAYTKTHRDQILLIKELRDNYFLPIPEIKKVVRQARRQSPADQAVSRFNHRYFRPLDRLLNQEVVGEEAFRMATGIGKKWLDRFADWKIITASARDGEPVYSQDDVIIARLIVDMDRNGFGPSEGYDPESLRRISDFLRGYIRDVQRDYYRSSLERLSSREMVEKGARFNEIMSLFFYHLYRKLVREEYHNLRRSLEESGPPAGR